MTYEDNYVNLLHKKVVENIHSSEVREFFECVNCLRRNLNEKNQITLNILVASIADIILALPEKHL